MRSPPIFNYSRIFYWTSSVDRIANAFHAASDHRAVHLTFESKSTAGSYSCVDTDRQSESRKCCQQDIRKVSIWGHCGIFVRMAIASFLGLMLQWFTAGAAAIIALFKFNHLSNPGIGCRSGSYFVYALLSSVVWFLMVLSSILAYYCDAVPLKQKLRSADSPPRNYPPHPFLRELAISLNILGKILCTLNALWIICVCMMHFSNTFNRCICNSGIFGTRSAKDSFSVLTYGRKTEFVWLGGIAMTFMSATVFVWFVWAKQHGSARRRNRAMLMC